MGDNRRRKEDDKLIRRRGNNQVLSADIFSQLETRLNDIECDNKIIKYDIFTL